MVDAGFSQACVTLVHRLADLSGDIALKHFRTPLDIVAKSDASPVTIADQNAEAAMRETIRKAFPDHGIIGEEHGSEQTDAEWIWILDPIDGTASFINGVPLFGTLIGLWQRTGKGAKAYLGCINHPAMKDRWLGGQGVPASLNGQPAKVRTCGDLKGAALFATGPDYFAPAEREAFARLERSVRQRRYGGTDCYHYGMVASGWTDIACEAGLKLHDYAAIVPVLEAAGAVVTDWKGGILDLDSEKTENGCVVACGDAKVHAAAVRLLSGKA